MNVIWRLIAIFGVVVMLLAGGTAGGMRLIQLAAPRSSVVVIHANHFDVSPPLRVLRHVAVVPGLHVPDGSAARGDRQDSGNSPEGDQGGDDVGREIDNHPLPSLGRFHQSDPVVQRNLASTPQAASSIAAGVNFDGVDSAQSACECAPPDTNAVAGLHDVVETVNTDFAVYQKDGTQVLPATPINTLFAGFNGDGGACQVRNDGDPVVLYDQAADRWLITQFTAAAPYEECLAVSTTGDPTGSYYRYGFPENAAGGKTELFGDYPHLGIWPVQGNDAYFMTTNEFDATSGVFQGPEMWAMDREKMLAGDPSAVLVGSGPQTAVNNPILPADADEGNLPGAPPANTPNYMLEYPQMATSNQPPVAQEYFGMFNSANPSASTFNAGPAISRLAPFSNSFTCSTDPQGAARECLPQEGTTQEVDPIADRYMYRLAYRDVNGVEELLTNFTVNVSSSGNQAAPRWMEIDNPGCPTTNCPSTTPPTTAPSVAQQGSYAPDATTDRWMASFDADRQGDELLGYSVTSAAMYPSIRVAGRTPSDTANTLEDELDMLDGTKSQTSPDRWGDYSEMKVDPTDGCTFWYSQEYSKGGDFNWGTRIASYRFNGCVNTPTSVNVSATSPSSAGSVSYVTVTVRDAQGFVASTYRGTVSFTSSDGSAVLPSTYTFTAADSGSHTFPVVFNTTGSQTITAQLSAGFSKSAAVTVTPAAARLVVSAPSSIGAGLPLTFTVTAQDAKHTTLTGYTGTVHFTSSDSKAVLPADYTFTTTDKGTHTFMASCGATVSCTTATRLFTLGSQTVTATDTGTSSITGTSAPITVAIVNTFVNGASGNDTTNSCTTSKDPCQTIGGALAKTSYGGTLTVSPGTYTENIVIDHPLSLVGAGAKSSATIIDGGAKDSTVIVKPQVTATISDVQIQNGDGTNRGEGGGVLNQGNLTLDGDTITGNTVSGGLGAGIYSDFYSTISVFNSTISNNTAPSPATSPVTGAVGSGGALYNRADHMVIVNSTITGNTAARDAGIRVRLGDVKIYNSTIVGNVATSSGAGGIDIPAAPPQGTVEIGNTILAKNTVAGTTPNSTTPSDCVTGGSSAFTSLGHNLIGDGQGCAGLTDGASGDQVGNNTTQKDPQLGSLQDNGGLTATMAPTAGSPVIGAADAGVCTADPVADLDQRGVARPLVGCTIGAFEAPGTPIVKGWNAIDVPLAGTHIADAAGLVSSLTAPGQVQGSINAVATYSNGRFNLFTPAYSPPLSLGATQGVFVLSTGAGRWTPGGTAYTSAPSVSLTPGWNLIAAPVPSRGLSGADLDTQLGGANGCGMAEASVYAGGSYHTYVAGSGTNFRVPPVSGFWLQCARTATWTPSS